MKKLTLALTLLVLIASSCTKNKKEDKQMNSNPFLTEYDTPFQVPPFDLIDTTDFIPAFKAGIEQENAEIEAIVNNPEEPTFENTIVPFDQVGEILRKARVFYTLNGANTNPTLQRIARELSPMMSAHYNEINMNQELFKRIKAVYDKRESLDLDKEQMRVVEKYYKDFERSGAALPEEQREELKKINEELSMLSLQFGENLLAETNDFKLVIDNKDDLVGLPDGVISAAAEAAKQNDMEGKWVFTLHKPSWIPFITYSPKRELREKIYKAMYHRGDNDNEYDNKDIIKQIIKLRDRKAELLGFDNYAAYVIAENMAKTPENVYDFLDKVWNPALEVSKQERDEMQKIINKEGGNFKLQSWDWWYYAEKLRKQKYDLDEEELKPYFSLDNVREGIFHVANKLYGLTFEERTDIPVYNDEVKAYEVKEADGSHLAVLYIDSYPRPGKSGGAWCGAMRSGAYDENGEKIYPVVYIVTNFTRPTGDKPALLTWDETSTFFHEFGHALHNFFADGHYRRTSRDVPRDYVELPSQIMENWAGEPEVLKAYAKHYKTGETIPDELIQKIQNSGHFNQGFVTVEYVAAALLDMDWHTTSKTDNIDVNAFEKNAMDEIGLIDEIIPRYRSTYFSHIFDGGYAAGYYVYLWAEVLDADAFNAFKESGDIYNQELAAKFRKYVLSENSMGDGMEQYLKFRGKEPTIEPLLEKRGLK